jgi:hypothetical protein
MVNTRNGAGAAHPNGPPPPPTLTQAIAAILESRDEQTELLHQLMENSAHGGNGGEKRPWTRSHYLCRLFGNPSTNLH